MKNRKGILFLMLCAGMEMFWLYAWAAFIMSAARGFFPFPGALIAFVLGAIITYFSTGRGLRIISVIAVQASVFGAAILIIVYLTYFLSNPLFNNDWFVKYFMIKWSFFEWLNFILIIFWSVLFWISGSVFSGRTISYYKLCARFDIGIAAFLCLFIIKLILLIKGNIIIDDISFTLIFPFFLFSLLAIGMIKTQNSSKSFLPGFRGIGIIAGIILVIILSAVSFILLMPVLTQTADISYSVLKRGAGFILPVITRIIGFIFGPRRSMQSDSSGSSRDNQWNFLSEGGWWTVIEDILQRGLYIIGVVSIIFISGFLLYYLFKWLFSKTAIIRRNVIKPNDGAPWYVRLWAFLAAICRVIIRSLIGYQKAVELYRMLLHWGRRSGVTCFINETPLEYGAKLKYYFPRLQFEIDLIVGAFNNEVYGGINLPHELITNARSAWRKLRSPRNWPLRLKLLLITDRHSLVKFIKN